MENYGLPIAQVLKKIPVNKGGARATGGTGKTGIPILPILLVFLVFPVFLVFLVFPLGCPAPASSIDQKRRERRDFCAKQEGDLRSLLDANEEGRHSKCGAKSTRYMCFEKNAENAMDARHTRKRSPQFTLVNEEAVVGIWSKGIRKMSEQRVADCGENFVPNKKASPQLTMRK